MNVFFSEIGVTMQPDYMIKYQFDPATGDITTTEEEITIGEYNNKLNLFEFKKFDYSWISKVLIFLYIVLFTPIKFRLYTSH